MGVSLDELLASSGISSLEDNTEKVASDESAQPDDVDLVSALRKYAESTEQPQEEETTVKAAAAQELAEKTAEILVIKQTIDEIEKVASLGMDKGQAKLAAFIKTALDKGYSEEQIAGLLKKAKAGRIGRAVQYAGQAVSRGQARSATKRIDKIVDKEYRLFRDTLRRGSPNEISKRIAEIEGKLGKEELEIMLKQYKDEGFRIPKAAVGFLPKPAGQKIKLEVGGKTHEIATGKAKKYMYPGIAGAAGLAVGSRTSGSKGKGSGRPVTVVQ